MRSALIIVIVFFTLSSLAESLKYTADLFRQGTGRSEKMYTLVGETTINPDGKAEVRTFYKDMTGKAVVEEKTQLDGSKLVKYEVEHAQSEQKGSVEVKGDRVYFTHTNKGETKTSDEKLQSTLVISGNFARFVKDNFDKIKEGKEVEFRYAAWQRRETVGFEIFKIGEEKLGGQDAIVVKMKPSSFIIAALVKPLVFKYNADGSRLLELNGRVPPMEKKGDSFKDLDAEVVYKYE